MSSYLGRCIRSTKNAQKLLRWLYFRSKSLRATQVKGNATKLERFASVTFIKLSSLSWQSGFVMTEHPHLWRKNNGKTLHVLVSIWHGHWASTINQARQCRWYQEEDESLRAKSHLNWALAIHKKLVSDYFYKSKEICYICVLK